MWWRLAVLVWCVTSGCAGAEYLLPGAVAPRHYDLRLAFDVDPHTNYSFFGVVDIVITAKKQTSAIVLHAQDFSIAKDRVALHDHSRRETFIVTGVEIDSEYSFATIRLDKSVQATQNYTLTVPFYGNLREGLDGVYISSYVDKATKTKEYLVATQFEAISARKGFPCFDEPMYKATFAITIGHHKDYSAVSNMPLLASSEDNALKEFWPWNTIEAKFKKDSGQFVFDRFRGSVPMSTYLVAWVVSRFAHVVSAPQLSTTEFRIWARKDAIDQTAYAAKIGPQVLTHFEEFFNVSFPLPKQDMFAIPDFAAGAMENWGLITYRETALLYDKRESSFTNKERVAEVIAHELAHQWFGNLVTMKWWSDLWLNEGFATFVAALGVAAVEPTWHADQDLAVDSMLAIMSLDALESSHPVSVPIDDPKRINEIFDVISYRKGATLIRMMTLFLGQRVFREGIHQYLVKHSYNNAEQDDLWRELTEVSARYDALPRNLTVKRVMDAWTTQTGYPLLTVQRDYGGRSVTLTQKRYLNLGAKSSTAVSWWIPLSVMCESEVGQEPDPVQWLADTEGVHDKHRFEHAASSKEWILFNPDMIAPYRINYDQRNWQLLTAALAGPRFTDIPTLGRVQLLSDAFALAWNNRLDYTITLQLAKYLQRETEFLPLHTGLSALAKIENVLRRSADYGAFQKFARRLVHHQYHQAGGLARKQILDGDDLHSVKMQTLTSSWACRMKIPGCEENAGELFQSWMDMDHPDDYNPIPLDLRRTVYCVAVSRGGVAEWRFTLARLQRANVAAARLALQRALACSRDVWLLQQYLEWTVMEGSVVRRQDAGRVFTDITSTPIGFYVARDFIYTRIDDISKAFQGQGRRMGGLVKALLAQFTTQRELDEFLTWKAANSKHFEDSQLAVSQAVEAAKVNIAWLDRNRRIVVDKLREFSTETDDDIILKYVSWCRKQKCSAAAETCLNSVVVTTAFLIHIV